MRIRPDKSFVVLMLGVGAAIAFAGTAHAAAVMPVSGMPTKVSSRGIAFIKNEEGFASHAYADGKSALGTQLYSIGYGHQIVSGDGLTPQSILTPEQAEFLLQQDIVARERAIMKSVRVPLKQNQFDALASLAFNIGIAAFQSSTLVKKLNAGDYKGALAEFVVWNKSGGKVNSALVARRKREADLFAAA